MTIETKAKVEALIAQALDADRRGAVQERSRLIRTIEDMPGVSRKASADARLVIMTTPTR